MRIRRGDRVAAGLPLRFDRFQVAGADQAGLPGNLQPFTAPASPRKGGGSGDPGGALAR